MKAVPITEKIFWVGAVDWDLRNFHGYLTQKGSTYNSYLVIDDKVTLVDTVKITFFHEMLERIKSVIDPSKIDYIISNHTEMDHSGSIPEILKLCPNAQIICSPNGVKGLKEHFKKEWNFKEVKSGDILKTGKYSYNFILTPMIHWPDNMVSYLPEEKILFSNDAFGQHLATSEKFDDEYYYEIIMNEAKKYYANIVLPYSGQVQKALADVQGLDIKIIAPSHGIMWRKHIPEIIKEYKAWSENIISKKALIIYDTMWNSTKIIANGLQRIFNENGYHTKLLNLQFNHMSDIMTDVIDAEYICVGSPTLNNNMLPTVAAFLTYLKGLAPKKRKGLAFGSYGWGGQSVDLINEVLSSSGFQMLEKIKMKYIPDEIKLEEELKKLDLFLKQ